MAINNDSTNKLYAANDTSVKFYTSLTRNQALGKTSIGVNEDDTLKYVEPGAICFVSDDKGNSIFLNNLLFGDGAHASSADSGGGSSGGITEVNLSDLVVVETDGTTLKTLADYFNADGTFLSESLVIYETATDSLGETYQKEIVKITKDGITINDKAVATQEYVTVSISENNTTLLESTLQQADTAESNAKAYADTLLTSIYIVKGSVDNYSDLDKIENPKEGWVYNVIGALGKLGQDGYVPSGTNYVYTTSRGWDALGGTIDLSAYSTTTTVEGLISTSLETAKSYTDTEVGKVSDNLTVTNSTVASIQNSLTSMNSSIETNSANIETNKNNIETNTTNITNIGTQLTWQ